MPTYDLTLVPILEEFARYVRDSGFTVTVDEPFDTVAIDGPDGRGFFLQDAEAAKYIKEARADWENAGELSLDDAFTGHAKSYVDAL